MRALTRPLRCFWFDLHYGLRGFSTALRAFLHPLTVITLLLIAAVTAGLIWKDQALLHWLNAYRFQVLEPVARWFSYWGDYPTGSLTVVGLLWLAGFFVRKVGWRRAALSALIAATITGTFSVITRCTLGRPRPCAKIEDGLYGPSTSYNYQAFPSGHSATAWGTATALVITAPPVGIPLAVGAAGVVWSRLYLQRHYPSDVFAGSWIGILGGLIAGMACRHFRRPLRSTPLLVLDAQTASEQASLLEELAATQLAPVKVVIQNSSQFPVKNLAACGE